MSWEPQGSIQGPKGADADTSAFTRGDFTLTTATTPPTTAPANQITLITG